VKSEHGLTWQMATNSSQFPSSRCESRLAVYWQGSCVPAPASGGLVTYTFALFCHLHELPSDCQAMKSQSTLLKDEGPCGREASGPANSSTNCQTWEWNYLGPWSSANSLAARLVSQTSRELLSQSPRKKIIA
jgi:hypothetical protein